MGQSTVSGSAATVGAGRLAELVGPLDAHRPPLHAALARVVRQLLGDGRLPLGVRLPSERGLAQALRVSRGTVTAAYAQLGTDGWLAARRGAGSWTRLPGSSHVRPAWVPADADDGVLDLVHASPSASPAVAAALAVALTGLPELLPTHGYHADGFPVLRRAVAERFTRRGLPTTPDQVVVTSGALQASVAALDLLTTRGDRVLVEHPTYPNVLDAMEAAGLRTVPVATEGLDDDELVRAFSRAARSTGARVAYLMPDFQNPTGRLLDDAARQRLAATLASAGATLVVDETFCELGLDDAAAPVPTAASGPRGAVLTAGTASKAFWGGLSVGWVRAEREQAQRVSAVLARRNIGVGVVDQLAVAHLLGDADALLVPHRAELRRRRDLLLGLLGEHLPAWDVVRPAGGLFLWAHIGASSSELASAAADRGLRLVPGSRFGTGHAFDDRLRLPFSHPEPVLRAAVGLLVASWADLHRGRRPTTPARGLVL